MMLTLHVSHIRKSYNGTRVLEDCSFTFERPGIYVLMGPNGCGKSTFLRLCSLLEGPDAGAVDYFYDGKPLQKDIGLRRRITLVLPRVGVFRTSVLKNAAYGLRIRGISRKEAEEEAVKALSFVGLSGKQDHNARTLSSGEVQRLGIARAMAINPEILLLDEPTASVDETNTLAIEDIILRMKRSGSSTVVITTHDKEQAARLADFLLVMKDGKLLPGTVPVYGRSEAKSPPKAGAGS